MLPSNLQTLPESSCNSVQLLAAGSNASSTEPGVARQPAQVHPILGPQASEAAAPALRHCRHSCHAVDHSVCDQDARSTSSTLTPLSLLGEAQLVCCYPDQVAYQHHVALFFVTCCTKLSQKHTKLSQKHRPDSSTLSASNKSLLFTRLTGCQRNKHAPRWSGI